MRPVPKTPFATRLSGSSKELRVRIQNIVRGPKKRPPLVLAAPVLALTVLCGSLVAFVSPGEEVPPPPPPVVNIVDQAPDMPGPVQPNPEEAQGPTPPPAVNIADQDPVLPEPTQPDPVQPNSEEPQKPIPPVADTPAQTPDPAPSGAPEPEPNVPTLPADVLASLKLPNGIAYLMEAPAEVTPYYTYRYNDLYWLTPEGTVFVDRLPSRGNVCALRTVQVLGLNCLEAVCYDLLEDGSVDTSYFWTTFFDLDREDGVPACVLHSIGGSWDYVDINQDGIVDIYHPGWSNWFTRTPGGRVINVEGTEWTELPGEGWLIAEMSVDGLNFQAVAGDMDLLYWWPDGGTRTELGCYSDGIGKLYPILEGFSDGLSSYDYYRYPPRSHVLGRRVIGLFHAMGGRYMLDFYAIDTPEPTLLFTIEHTATQFCDLDGDGIEELIFESGKLYPADSDMEPFCFIYTCSPDGQPLYADLAQVWPEFLSRYENGCRFDENGNFRENTGNGEPVLSGAEIMDMINAAGAWSGQLPTSREIIQRTGALV